jgi:hypothetical protein
VTEDPGLGYKIFSVVVVLLVTGVLWRLWGRDPKPGRSAGPGPAPADGTGERVRESSDSEKTTR